MAYNLSVNPYERGNEVFDNTPYTNFAIQAMAHQQAKEDALKKTLQDLTNRVTSTGFDTKDADVINQKIKAAQDFAIANKRAVQRGGKEWQQLNYLFNDAYNTAKQSKEDMEAHKKMAELAIQHKDLVTPQVLEHLGAYNNPIGSEKYQRPNLSLLTQVPVFKEPEYLENRRKAYKATDLKTEYQYDKTGNYQTPIITKGIDFDKHKDDIIQGGINDYRRNNSFANEINLLHKKLVDNPDEFKKFDDVYFQNTGKHINISPDGSHDDLAAAWSLVKVPYQTQTIGKTEETPAYKEYLRKKNLQDAANIQYQKAVKLEGLKQGMQDKKAKDAYDAASKYIDDLTPKNVDQLSILPSPTGEKTVDIKLTPVLNDVLKREGSVLLGLKYNPEKNVYIPTYRRGADKKTEYFGDPLTKEQMIQATVSAVPKVKEFKFDNNAQQSQQNPQKPQMQNKKTKGKLY
jgi:hypothetical protein